MVIGVNFLFMDNICRKAWIEFIVDSASNQFHNLV